MAAASIKSDSGPEDIMTLSRQVHEILFRMREAMFSLSFDGSTQ
jgi:hypothetical protein